jgi:hypothetical protein
MWESALLMLTVYKKNVVKEHCCGPGSVQVPDFSIPDTGSRVKKALDPNPEHRI